MDFDKAYDKLDWVRGQLESTVSNSRVDLMPSDMGDFFITVTQRNETTGNDSTWSFCVNVDDNYVQMLEPTEDEEKFTTITEVYSIIKSFLQGGMSREKRRNMPEYNPGEPIKITGKGNKIGSSNKTVIRQGPNLKTLDETVPEHIMKNLDAYKGYTRYDMEELVLKPSGYILYDASNNGRDIVYKKRGATKDDNSIVLYFRNGELKNAEIKSSRKPIKSSLSDVNKALGFTDNDIEEDGKIHITTDLGEFVVDYVNDEYVVSYDGEERIFTEYKDTVEEVVNLFNTLCNEEVEFFNKNINSSKKPIKSDKQYIVKISSRSFDGSGSWDNARVCYYKGGRFDSKEPQYLSLERAEEIADDLRHDEQLRPGFGNEDHRVEIEEVTSSRKSIKSDYSDEEYWYPETKKVYRLYKYNSNGDYYTWDYDTLEEAQRMKPRGNRYTTYNIKEVEVPVQSSRKPIKSDFNPYYEKHPDTFVAYLVGDKDSITQEDIDKAEREWYKLMYAGYGSLYGETGHLFLGPYENVKSYVEDYLGVGLLDDYLYTYNKDDSVLDHFETQSDKPLPTEQDYKDFVNQLNAFVAKNYETNPKYGPLYVFNMYKDDNMNSDGYGNEYPNFVIYDDEGNLDMHSDDSITEYIRQELEAKGWYPECVHSSSDFTIAIK